MIGWLIGTRLGKALSGLLTALVILWATYVAGKRQEASEARTEALEGYVKTKEKIDEVQPTSDRDANTERLRRTGIIRKGDL